MLRHGLAPGCGHGLGSNVLADVLELLIVQLVELRHAAGDFCALAYHEIERGGRARDRGTAQVRRGADRDGAEAVADAAALRDAISTRWRVRDDRYSEFRGAETTEGAGRVEMFRVGG